MWSLVMMILILHNINSATVLQGSIYVMETGSFLQYMSNLNKDLIWCKASFQDEGINNITFTLDTKSTDVLKPSDFKDSYNLSSRLSSLGHNLCGMKLINSSRHDPMSWTLTASDSQSDYFEYNFKVIQYPYNADEMYSVIKVTPGIRTSIHCGRAITQSQDFCKLYNPLGELVFTGRYCDQIIVATMADVGRWRCLIGGIQMMEPLEYVVDLIIEERIRTIGWITEEEDHYSIGCKILNYRSNWKPNFCTMLTPSGRELTIRHGRTTQRYNTLKTNLTSYICGIEIPKPLRNSELGIWKCTIGRRGKILNLGNVAVAVPNYPKYHVVSTLHRGTVDITCTVPYSSPYCHITSPHGTRHPSTSPDMIELGQCSFRIDEVSDLDKGIWTCSFAKENETVLDEIKVEVRILDLMTYNAELMTSTGESLELLCKTGGDPGAPVDYCWYLSPNNISYYLHEKLETKEFSYIGRGFNYGDCSVRINTIKAEHFGNWTCVTQIGGKDEITVRILVSARPLLSDSAWVILISVTALLVIVLIIIMVAFLYKLKRRREFEDGEAVVFSRRLRGRDSIQSFTSLDRMPNENHFNNSNLRLRR